MTHTHSQRLQDCKIPKCTTHTHISTAVLDAVRLTLRLVICSYFIHPQAFILVIDGRMCAKRYDIASVEITHVRVDKASVLP